MKKTLTLLLLFCSVFYFKATAATLKHSYAFNDGAKDAPGSGVTAVDGVLNGGGTISNGVYANTTDGYISFDGSALAINTYSAITLEAYIKASAGLNNDDWTVMANFGNNGDNLLFMSNTRGGWIGTTAFAKAGTASCEIAFYPKKDDGLVHHLVTVLSGNSLKLYMDGVLLESKSGAPNVADLGTAVATLGTSMWGWDPKWKGSISQFNIYDGELTAQEIQDNATAFLTGANDFNSNTTDATLSGISLSAGSFRSAFASDQTTYSALLPFGTTTVSPSVVVTTSGATYSGTEAVDVSSSSGTSTIVVTAKDGVTQKTYTINYTVAVTASIRHSYTFNDGANDTPASGVTAVNGVLNSTASVASGKLTLAGGYVSFDGAALNLNAYNGITFEYYIKPTAGANTGHWNWFSYFGADWGNDCIMMGDGTWDKYRFTKNNSGDGNVEVARTDDGALHHLVGIVTGGVIKMYVDGSLIGQQATSKQFILGTTVAYLGRAFWDDPSWQGVVDEFNIYEGELTESQIAANAQNYLTTTDVDKNLQNSSFVATAKNKQIIINGLTAGKLNIYNVVGTLIYSTSISANQKSIIIPVQSGKYLLQIIDGNLNKTQKMIVK